MYFWQAREFGACTVSVREVVPCEEEEGKEGKEGKKEFVLVMLVILCSLNLKIYRTLVFSGTAFHIHQCRTGEF